MANDSGDCTATGRSGFVRNTYGPEVLETGGSKDSQDCRRLEQASTALFLAPLPDEAKLDQVIDGGVDRLESAADVPNGILHGEHRICQHEGNQSVHGGMTAPTSNGGRPFAQQRFDGLQAFDVRLRRLPDQRQANTTPIGEVAAAPGVLQGIDVKPFVLMDGFTHEDAGVPRGASLFQQKWNKQPSGSAVAVVERMDMLEHPV